jgi:hypothetical protein
LKVELDIIGMDDDFARRTDEILRDVVDAAWVISNGQVLIKVGPAKVFAAAGRQAQRRRLPRSVRGYTA